MLIAMLVIDMQPAGYRGQKNQHLLFLTSSKALPPGLAESFANSFAKGTESLLAVQDKKLASQELLPPALPEPLAKGTNLQYRKGKRRAMTGLEVAEEREQDASHQR